MPPPLYLFTWNLQGKADAEGLALTHLAQCADQSPLVAALQELPKEGEFALARTEDRAKLKDRNIEVVKCGKGPRIALAYHPSLVLLGDARTDTDDEFVSAVFRQTPSRRRIGVVAVHARGMRWTHSDAERGGARALLRHAINALIVQLRCSSLIVLGDFNSHYQDREIRTWDCFNAVSGFTAPTDMPSYAKRRGLDHAALRVVVPSNPAMSTYPLPAAVPNQEPQILDFIVVDQGTYLNATSTVMTSLAGSSVFDASKQRPSVSDHLPVEGHLHV